MLTSTRPEAKAAAYPRMVAAHGWQKPVNQVLSGLSPNGRRFGKAYLERVGNGEMEAQRVDRRHVGVVAKPQWVACVPLMQPLI